MTINRREALLAGLSGVVVLSGCGPKSESSGNGEKPKVVRKIGYSAMSLENPFFQLIADTMVEEGKQYNMEFVINDADGKPIEQAKQIENYIALGLEAIVINPVDRTALGPAIKKANEAGIPVFTSDLQSIAEGAKITAHVGTDNLQGGRLAGDAMIEAIGDQGGNVVVVHYKQAHSCVLRVQGFTERIEEHNKKNPEKKIEIVAEVDGGGSRPQGFKAVNDVLPATPNLAGLFAINDPSAIGAWRALKDADRQDQVTIIGFDGFIDGKRAILEGKIYADPIQFPKQMAKKTVENIITYINGGDIEPLVLIPTKLYRKSDAENDPELKAAPAS